MSKLTNSKIDILVDISTIKKLKDSLSNPKLGFFETITLALKIFSFVSLTIQGISLKSKLADIEKLIYVEEQKIDDASEANRNEGIG